MTVNKYVINDIEFHIDDRASHVSGPALRILDDIAENQLPKKTTDLEKIVSHLHDFGVSVRF